MMIGLLCDVYCIFFFFKQKTAYEMRISDWSSDVCSSDLDGLARASMIPPSWYGQGVEGHDAPTRFGTLSFAIRWHGERPAILWELEPHDPGTAVLLTCPGLDPTWQSTDLRGEALLAAPPDASPSAAAPGPDEGTSFG